MRNSTRSTSGCSAISTGRSNGPRRNRSRPSSRPSAICTPIRRRSPPSEDHVMRKVRYRAALNEALREELDRDPTVFLMGEDLREPWGGTFRVTQGLSTDYGDDRVLNTPISENGFLGVALGCAITGPQAGRRAHAHGLRHDGDGPAHQPDPKDPVHDRRAGVGAASRAERRAAATSPPRRSTASAWRRCSPTSRAGSSPRRRHRPTRRGY